MVYSTLHWKPLVNGYAGIEPRRYVQLRELLRSFPSPESLAALRAVGTRYVVVHRKGYGPNQWERLEARMPEALGGAPRAGGARDDTVYELACRRIAVPGGSTRRTVNVVADETVRRSRTGSRSARCRCARPERDDGRERIGRYVRFIEMGWRRC